MVGSFHRHRGSIENPTFPYSGNKFQEGIKLDLLSLKDSSFQLDKLCMMNLILGHIKVDRFLEDKDTELEIELKVDSSIQVHIVIILFHYLHNNILKDIKYKLQP